MERRLELERMRRSLAMLSPGTPGLDREKSIALIEELQNTYTELRIAKAGR